jgi:hypothetical protein
MTRNCLALSIERVNAMKAIKAAEECEGTQLQAVSDSGSGKYAGRPDQAIRGDVRDSPGSPGSLGRKFQRHMPRYATPENPSPFGQILIEYMDRTRQSTWGPALSTGQLAIKLNTSRQTIHNWIYKAQTPSIENILTVFATLNIPLNELLERYQSQGVPLPPVFDMPTTHPAAPAPAPEGKRSQAAGATTPASAHSQRATHDDSPSPHPYVAPVNSGTASADSDDWQRLAEQTAAAMRDEGAPQPMIDAVLAHIRAQQTGTSPLARQVSAEHTASPNETQTPNDHPDTRRARGRPAGSRTPTTR